MYYVVRAVEKKHMQRRDRIRKFSSVTRYNHAISWSNVVFFYCILSLKNDWILIIIDKCLIRHMYYYVFTHVYDDVRVFFFNYLQYATVA